MATKHHYKKSNDSYTQGLDKDDPFDQLIMELASKGILDVSAVEIHQAPPAPETEEYSKKLLPHKGKHASQ
jgi:hypothetical protein